MSLSHFIVAALMRIYFFDFIPFILIRPNPGNWNTSTYFAPVHWSSIRMWKSLWRWGLLIFQVKSFFSIVTLWRLITFWTAMDLKCNCLNCQNASCQGAIGTGPQFDSNKRYETYRNGDTFENQVFNIPERQREWFWIGALAVIGNKRINRFIFSVSFNSYGNQQRGYNPVYRTTSSDYGWIPPTEYTVPHR